MSKDKKVVLTIAGSDSCGGAGVQADIKTISALGAYAASAITVITAQNTLGVDAIFPLPVDIISAQIESILSDMPVAAIKIGMLYSAEIIEQVAISLADFRSLPVIIDPVMVSQSGRALLNDDALSVLEAKLFPMVSLITPNLPEASVLLGEDIVDVNRAAELLAKKYDASILLKGGHLEGEECVDVLYDIKTQQLSRYPGKRIDTRNNHGTGCTLSSGIAAFIAQGFVLEEAVLQAKAYLTKALLSSQGWRLGSGAGPLGH